MLSCRLRTRKIGVAPPKRIVAAFDESISGCLLSIHKPHLLQCSKPQTARAVRNVLRIRRFECCCSSNRSWFCYELTPGTLPSQERAHIVQQLSRDTECTLSLIPGHHASRDVNSPGQRPERKSVCGLPAYPGSNRSKPIHDSSLTMLARGKSQQYHE